MYSSAMPVGFFKYNWQYLRSIGKKGVCRTMISAEDNGRCRRNAIIFNQVERDIFTRDHEIEPNSNRKGSISSLTGRFDEAFRHPDNLELIVGRCERAKPI